MTADPVEELLGRVHGSSVRLRLAMGLTAALCLAIAAGIAADTAGWRTSPVWAVAAVAGVVFFVGTAAVLIWAAWRGQRRHNARLQDMLRNDPQRIRSIRVLVARATPFASWSPDDGSATRGLHIFVGDDTGRTWVLPVSRPEAQAVVASLAERCPRAVIDGAADADS